VVDDPHAALEAAVRTMAELDQKLAACRDANGRLTAALVAVEVRERIQQDIILNQAARIDDLEARLNRWGG
jgi:hypothetical protein